MSGSEQAYHPPRALDGLRVVELCGPLGGYCGKLFADLGADVLLVEPPGGSALRSEPPATRIDGVDHSLGFLYWHAGKRSVCLDLDEPDDVAQLLRLCAQADLVIDTQTMADAARRGLTWAERGPAQVVTRITAFGPDGPYLDRFDQEADDLIACALGGLLQLGGYADGSPIRPGGEQAVVAANLFAAVASMLALTHAEIAGAGQLVDVSMLESVVMALENAPQYYDLEGVIRRRTGGVQRLAGTGIFATADGYVCLLATGFGGTQHWTKLIDWLDAELDTPLEQFRDARWSSSEFLVQDEAKQGFGDVFAQFCATRTKADLYHRAQHWRVPLCPVNTPADIVDDLQLLFRQFLIELPVPGGGSVRMPGAPYRFSHTPWQPHGPAPLSGQHTEQVLASWGLIDRGAP